MPVEQLPKNTGPDWRSLSQSELDAAFNNSRAVSNSSSLVEGWNEKSASLRQLMGDHLDIPYAAGARNRFDYFRASSDGPVLIFIHGGYWQSRGKDTFSFCAAGALDQGINVALINYTLAPDASIGQMISETHLAIDHIVEKLPSLGGDRNRIILAGWSAGAHLAMMAAHHPSVKAVVGISGIYDLEPIRFTYINKPLQLTQHDVDHYSPIRQERAPHIPIRIVVGADELPLIKRQSGEFAKHCASSEYVEIVGANHFTILDELSSRDGKIAKIIRDLF